MWNLLETLGLCARIAPSGALVGCDEVSAVKQAETSMLMPPRVLAAAAGIAVVALFAGACTGTSQQSTVPTVPTAVQPAPRVVTLIRATVADTAFRGLAGVRVEIVNGPNAGTFAISDPDGSLSFVGTFAGALTFQATKDEYLAATQILDVQGLCASCDARIKFAMEALGTIARLEPGDYSLTLIADDACARLPAELRTRTYAATITRSSVYSAAYDVRVPGMLYEHGWFAIGISGNFLATEDDSYPTLFEPLPQLTYLGIDFLIRNVFETSRESVISVRFPGVFEYCALKADPIDIRFCEFVPAENLVAHERCYAEHHQMILVRR